MNKYLRYRGTDHVLGEVVGETHDRFYWLVRSIPTKQQPKSKIVCHPKWSTEVLDITEIQGAGK